VCGFYVVVMMILIILLSPPPLPPTSILTGVALINNHTLKKLSVMNTKLGGKACFIMIAACHLWNSRLEYLDMRNNPIGAQGKHVYYYYYYYQY